MLDFFICAKSSTAVGMCSWKNRSTETICLYEMSATLGTTMVQYPDESEWGRAHGSGGPGLLSATEGWRDL